MVNRSVWTYFSKHARVIDSGRRNRTFFSESVAFKSWGRARRSLEDLARLRLVGRLWPSLDERKEPVPPSLKVFLVGLGFTKQVTRPPGPSFSHGRGSTYLNLPSTAGQSLGGPAALPVDDKSYPENTSLSVPSLRFLERAREPSTNLSLSLAFRIKCACIGPTRTAKYALWRCHVFSKTSIHRFQIFSKLSDVWHES